MFYRNKKDIQFVPVLRTDRRKLPAETTSAIDNKKYKRLITALNLRELWNRRSKSFVNGAAR